MTDTLESQSSVTELVSYGDAIRAEREKRGISIEQMSESTRISHKHLTDLENNQASGISSYGFVVGYIRTLANFLSLDADELVEMFHATTKSEQRTSALEKFVEPQSPSGRSALPLVWIVVAIVVFVVLVGVGSFWFFNLYDRGQTDTDSANVNELEESPEPIDAAYIGSSSTPSDSETLLDDRSFEPNSLPVGEPTSGNAAASLEDFLSDLRNTYDDEEDFNATDVDEDGDVVADSADRSPSDPLGIPVNFDSDSGSAEDDEPFEDSASIPSSEGNGDVTNETEEDTATPALHFEFDEDSWLIVQDADGNSLVNSLQRADTTLELEGTEPFSIQLGYAHGVRLEYKGKEISLESHITERSQAQFTLPE